MSHLSHVRLFEAACPLYACNFLALLQPVSDRQHLQRGQKPARGYDVVLGSGPEKASWRCLRFLVLLSRFMMFGCDMPHVALYFHQSFNNQEGRAPELSCLIRFCCRDSCTMLHNRDSGPSRTSSGPWGTRTDLWTRGSASYQRL